MSYLLCICLPPVSFVQEDSVSESSSDAGLGSEPESETTTIGKSKQMKWNPNNQHEFGATGKECHLISAEM